MPKQPAPQEELPRGRILVVEDHFDSREALRILLESLGFQVSVAGDGRAGVEAALAQLPDLILMDMMMPEVDGFEAMRQLRQQPSTRELPIIAVTAMEGARELALSAGANDFIPKPIDTHSLIRKIQGWLERQVA